MTDARKIYSPFLADIAKHAIAHYRDQKEEDKLDTLLKKIIQIKFKKEGIKFSGEQEEEFKVNAGLQVCKEHKVEHFILLQCFLPQQSNQEDVYLSAKIEMFAAARLKYRAKMVAKIDPYQRIKRIIYFGFLAMYFPVLPSQQDEDIAKQFAEKETFPLYESLLFVLEKSNIFFWAIETIHRDSKSNLRNPVKYPIEEIKRMLTLQNVDPEFAALMKDNSADKLSADILIRVINLQARKFLQEHGPVFDSLYGNIKEQYEYFKVALKHPLMRKSGFLHSPKSNSPTNAPNVSPRIMQISPLDRPKFISPTSSPELSPRAIRQNIPRITRMIQPETKFIPYFGRQGECILDSPFLKDCVQNAIAYFRENKAEEKLDQLLKTALVQNNVSGLSLSAETQQQDLGLLLKSCKEQKTECAVLLKCFSHFPATQSEDMYSSAKVAIFQAARSYLKPKPSRQFRGIFDFALVALHFGPISGITENAVQKYVEQKDMFLFEHIFFVLEKRPAFRDALNAIFKPYSNLNKIAQIISTEIYKTLQGSELDALIANIQEEYARMSGFILCVLSKQARHFLNLHRFDFSMVYPQMAPVLTQFLGESPYPMMVRSGPVSGQDFFQAPLPSQASSEGNLMGQPTITLPTMANST